MASWGHFQQAEVRSRPTATSTCAASSSAEMSSLAPLPTMPGGAIFDCVVVVVDSARAVRVCDWGEVWVCVGC